MKRYLRISLTLGFIALVCAALIAFINLLTQDTINKNEEKKKSETIEAIFEDYSSEKSEELKLKDGTSSNIEYIILVKNDEGAKKGYIYKVTGTNAYGDISLMVAINNDKVIQVEFLSNTQSYASTVNNYVKEYYPSSKSSDKNIGAYDEPESKVSGDYDSQQVSGLFVNCGATFGASLVKELVLIALNDTNREVA